MKNCLLIFIGLFCFLTTVLAQPANDDPCNAKIILPTQVVCNAYEDNSAKMIVAMTLLIVFCFLCKITNVVMICCVKMRSI